MHLPATPEQCPANAKTSHPEQPLSLSESHAKKGSRRMWAPNLFLENELKATLPERPHSAPHPFSPNSSGTAAHHST